MSETKTGTAAVLVAGEALIDLTHADPAGSAPGPDTPQGAYVAHPGGGPCNTSVALARLGIGTLFLGAVSTDAFGEQLRSHMAGSGVDLSLSPATDLPSTLAVATVDQAGHARYGFYMDGTSATQLHPADVPDPFPDSVSTVHVGTLGLVLEPTATTIVDMIGRVSEHQLVFLDPNVRTGVIPDLGAYHRRLVGLIRHSDIVKLSDDDARALHPDLEPDEVARRLSGLGPRLIVLTRGGASVSAHHGGDVITLEIPPVDVVDTIGAGDSFSAGLLAWLSDHGKLSKHAVRNLSAHDVRAALEFAARVAAVTVSRPGADPPRRSEL